ncbi:hypothetical protein RR48_09372 [Papilio machaon]|uniref:Uncharacterized protein n=1 Tax=Papilio machaon TaxID=76193 RepID=A0A194RC74_PAPMA|nr:hypothetical protein RR48_09372 [Papilio machaon]
MGFETEKRTKNSTKVDGQSCLVTRRYDDVKCAGGTVSLHAGAASPPHTICASGAEGAARGKAGRRGTGARGRAGNYSLSFVLLSPQYGSFLGSDSDKERIHMYDSTRGNTRVRACPTDPHAHAVPCAHSHMNTFHRTDGDNAFLSRNESDIFRTECAFMTVRLPTIKSTLDLSS